MTCLIIDDNPLARDIIKHLLKQYEWLTLIAECHSTEEARAILQKCAVDLIFLNVELPRISGIDFLKSLDKQPITIIITAYEKYAIKGYELNVADYLIKPVQPERFRLALEKAQCQAIVKFHTWELRDQDFVFIKYNRALQRIKYADILWMESKGDYVKIRCAEKSYMVYGTLKAMQPKLDNKGFIRIHRSYLIPLDKVERIEDGFIYINKEPIPVSENYWPLLKSSINIL